MQDYFSAHSASAGSGHMCVHDGYIITQSRGMQEQSGLPPPAVFTVFTPAAVRNTLQLRGELHAPLAVDIPRDGALCSCGAVGRTAIFLQSHKRSTRPVRSVYL